MAQINQLAGVSTSNGLDWTFKNYTGSDIPAGTAVKIDTGNLGDTNKPQGVIQTTDDTLCIGICLTSIPAGKTGSVRLGGAAVAIAGAAITCGVHVMSNSSGQVVAQTAGKYAIGWALTKADVATDAVLVMVYPAKNA